ncbi:MAG: hypothetical protein K2X93_00275 [Candidatus Obscuribacterales bacterium]|nr:hypothetical protein [Candidatus Obscuribacterales bacterium]
MNQVVLAAIAVVATLLAFASIPDKGDVFNSTRRVCDTRTQFESLEDNGEWQKAAELCQRALQSSNRKDLYRVSILLDLARMQAEANLPELAVASAEEAIRDLKSLPVSDQPVYLNEQLRAHALAAHLYRSQNKPQQAARILSDAQKLSTKRRIEPGGNLFECQLKFEQAMSIASAKPDQSQQLLGECVRLASKLAIAPKLYMHIAETYAQTLRPEQPYGVYMLEYCRAETKSQWGVLYHKGMRQLATDQFDEANRLLTEALDQLPKRLSTDPRVFLCKRGIAECMFRLGKFQAALALIDEERRLNLDFPLTTERAFMLHRAAQCHQALGQHRLALSLLEEERVILQPLLSKTALFKTKMWELMEDITDKADKPAQIHLLEERFDYLTSTKGVLSKKQVMALCSLANRICAYYHQNGDYETVETVARRTIRLVGQNTSMDIRHDLARIYNVRGHSRAERKMRRSAAEDLSQFIALSHGLESAETLARTANSAASLFIESKDFREGIRMLNVAYKYYDDPALKNHMLSIRKELEAKLGN